MGERERTMKSLGGSNEGNFSFFFFFCYTIIIIIKREDSIVVPTGKEKKRSICGDLKMCFFFPFKQFSFALSFYIPNTKELVSALDHHLMCRRRLPLGLPRLSATQQLILSRSPMSIPRSIKDGDRFSSSLGDYKNKTKIVHIFFSYFCFDFLRSCLYGPIGSDLLNF